MMKTMEKKWKECPWEIDRLPKNSTTPIPRIRTSEGVKSLRSDRGRRENNVTSIQGLHSKTITQMRTLTRCSRHCQQGKQTKTRFKSKEYSTTKPLQIVHTDLVGPTTTKVL
jgi:hypothetical protein